MRKAKNKSAIGGRPEEWFTIAQCCAALAVTRATFHESYRGAVPSAALHGASRAVRIHFRSLHDALVNRELEKQRGVSGGSEDDALVYAGSDSPNLERLRAAKAKIAEMDLTERQKTHVNVADLHQGLMRFAAHFRRGGEVLQRRFGIEAADIFNEAVNEAEGECRRELGVDGTDRQQEPRSNG